jgi:hypothetical protein
MRHSSNAALKRLSFFTLPSSAVALFYLSP